MNQSPSNLESALLEFATALLCVFFVTFVIAFSFAVVTSQYRGLQSYFAKLPQVVGVSLSFGLLAYASGFLTGFSRVAVVGNLLPAALGLIGGLGVYLFGRGEDGNSGNPIAVGTAVAAFSGGLILGFMMGTQDRLDAELAAFNRAFDIDLQFEQAARESLINTRRVNLGLEPIEFSP